MVYSYATFAIFATALALPCSSQTLPKKFQLLHPKTHECVAWRSDWFPENMMTTELDSNGACPSKNTSDMVWVTSFQSLSDGTVAFNDGSGRCLDLANGTFPVPYPQPETGIRVIVKERCHQAATLTLHRDLDVLRVQKHGQEVGCLKTGGTPQVGDYAYVGNCDKPAGSSNGWHLAASECTCADNVCPDCHCKSPSDCLCTQTRQPGMCTSAGACWCSDAKAYENVSSSKCNCAENVCPDCHCKSASDCLCTQTGQPGMCTSAGACWCSDAKAYEDVSSSKCNCAENVCPDCHCKSASDCLCTKTGQPGMFTSAGACWCSDAKAYEKVSSSKCNCAENVCPDCHCKSPSDCICTQTHSPGLCTSAGACWCSDAKAGEQAGNLVV